MGKQESAPAQEQVAAADVRPIEDWRDQAVKAGVTDPGSFDASGAFAIVKAFRGWATGKAVTFTEYTKAVDEALSTPHGTAGASGKRGRK
jgi:hypothetical protein